MVYNSITPAELVARKERGDRFTLIDVRELGEWELARVDSAELLPLSQFPLWLDRLDRADAIVVMCHHGIRSAHVCSHLVQQGFTSVTNLSGGIDRWSQEVDPSIPRY